MLRHLAHSHDRVRRCTSELNPPPLIVLVDYLIRSMHQNMSDSASHVPLAVFLMMWFMLLIGFVPQVFIVMNVIKKEVVERLGAGPSRVDS